MKTIAVVDDERDIVDIVSFYLEKERFRTSKFFDGKSFYKAFKKENFDAVVLDLMLPDINGVSLIEIIRRNEDKSHLPIIVLTAKSSETDIISVLESGADSYITKPFNGRVLTARVKALLRNKKVINKIDVANISINVEQHRIFCKEKEINLTHTEFEILKHLASRPGKVFTRSDLLDSIWKYAEEEPFDRAIDVHIRHIRSKLGKCGECIETIRGVGYKIKI